MNQKKVTYMLDKKSIRNVERLSLLSDISMSKVVSNCIEFGLQDLLEAYNFSDRKPIIGIIRKRKGTTKKSFTLPVKNIQILNWFSEKMDVKKSILLCSLIENFKRAESEKLSKEIEDFMNFIEEFHATL